MKDNLQRLFLRGELNKKEYLIRHSAKRIRFCWNFGFDEKKAYRVIRLFAVVDKSVL